MIYRIDLPPRINRDYLKIEQKGAEIITTLNNEIAIQRAEYVDGLLLDTLYEIYRDKADEVIVIDETEFKKFIHKHLPIYIKEKNLKKALEVKDEDRK